MAHFDRLAAHRPVLALSADDVFMADTGLLRAHTFADRRQTPDELYRAEKYAPSTPPVSRFAHQEFHK